MPPKLTADDVGTRERCHEMLAPDRRRAGDQTQLPGTPEKQMGVGLPGKPNAAVNLDIFLGGETEGVTGCEARRGRGNRQFTGIGVQSPGGVVSIGARQFIPDVHIREPMFDGLKAADRPAKHIALQRIITRHLQAAIGAADLLEGEQHSRALQYPVDQCKPAPGRPSGSACAPSKLSLAVAA